jgi:hypothetical protein
MLTIAKAQFKSFPGAGEVANQPFVMGSETFRGPFKSSVEVDDAPGLIAIFNADSMQLLNLYQTVSVRASAVLEIGAAPENTTVALLCTIPRAWLLTAEVVWLRQFWLNYLYK